MKQDQAGIEKFLDGLLSAYLGKYDSRGDFENSLKMMAPLFERESNSSHIKDADIISMGMRKFDEAVKVKLLN